jgi:hypothetical protein
LAEVVLDGETMTRRDENLYGLLPGGEVFTFNRYMVVQLKFDRESFEALKELLRKEQFPEYNWTRGAPAAESVEERRTRESLKRVFDQIRDMKYRDV